MGDGVFDTRRGEAIARAELVWVPVLLALPIHATLANAAAGWHADADTFTMALAGLLFVILGIAMPYTGRNALFGIRTSATFTSEAAWKRAHSVAGPVFVIGGSVMLALLPFFQGDAVIVPVMGAMVATTGVGALSANSAARREAP